MRIGVLRQEAERTECRAFLAHRRGSKTFTEYVLALKGLGVERYDSYLADGHSKYFGQGGHRVVSPPVHEVLPVEETGQRETFLEHLPAQAARDDLLRDVPGLGAERIEKWTVDTGKMTMTFYDKADREMPVELIK